MSDFPKLETERLKLVEVGHEYDQRLFDIFSRDDVTRYYGMNSLTDVQQAANMIDSFAKNFQDKRAIRWGMVVKETDTLIGTLGLNNLQLWNKRAEIGFETHPDFWRSGYTTEAVRAVLHYSFEELGLHRVGATTFPNNVASTQLLQRLHFQKEGLLRGYLYQNGRSHDAFVFSLLKTEFSG